VSKTKIEWCDAVWNPVTGCTKVSAGCHNCYAERMSKRLAGRAGYPAENPFAVTLHPDRLDQPLRWTKPRRIFVCSMGDLFHEDVDDEDRDEIFAVMAYAAEHQFQVLTKRPGRMREYLTTSSNPSELRDRAACIRETIHSDIMGQPDTHYPPPLPWPLPNVWLGVTAENQAAADERIPILLSTPAAVRFVSCEPLLGPVDLSDHLGLTWEKCHSCGQRYPDVYWANDEQWAAVVGDTYAGLRCPGCFQREAREFGFEPGFNTIKPPLTRLEWVIAGGESGPGARPMHPDWARSLRDQCQAAGVPFFFKAWGDWAPFATEAFYDDKPNLGGPCGGPWQISHNMSHPGTATAYGPGYPDGRRVRVLTVKEHQFAGSSMTYARVGKKAAGRELDGRRWDEVPS
jgi:protein gp37